MMYWWWWWRWRFHLGCSNASKRVANEAAQFQVVLDGNNRKPGHGSRDTIAQMRRKVGPAQSRSIRGKLGREEISFCIVDQRCTREQLGVMIHQVLLSRDYCDKSTFLRRNQDVGKCRIQAVADAGVPLLCGHTAQL